LPIRPHSRCNQWGKASGMSFRLVAGCSIWRPWGRAVSGRRSGSNRPEIELGVAGDRTWSGRRSSFKPDLRPLTARSPANLCLWSLQSSSLATSHAEISLTRFRSTPWLFRSTLYSSAPHFTLPLHTLLICSTPWLFRSTPLLIHSRPRRIYTSSPVRLAALSLGVTPDVISSASMRPSCGQWARWWQDANAGGHSVGVALLPLAFCTGFHLLRRICTARGQAVRSKSAMIRWSSTWLVGSRWSSSAHKRHLPSYETLLWHKQHLRSHKTFWAHKRHLPPHKSLWSHKHHLPPHEASLSRKQHLLPHEASLSFKVGDVGDGAADAYGRLRAAQQNLSSVDESAGGLSVYPLRH